jgi:hypothetical protein
MLLKDSTVRATETDIDTTTNRELFIAVLTKNNLATYHCTQVFC